MYLFWTIHSMGLSHLVLKLSIERDRGPFIRSTGDYDWAFQSRYRRHFTELLNPTVCFSVSLGTHTNYKIYKLLNSQLSWLDGVIRDSSTLPWNFAAKEGDGQSAIHTKKKTDNSKSHYQSGKPGEDDQKMRRQ